MATAADGRYPVTYDVQYPEDGLSRLTTVLRPLMWIPCWILDAILGGPGWLALILVILFRRKYPQWLFDYNVERARYSARVAAYSLLLTDRYPSVDDAQSVTLDIEPPDMSRLSRWMPLIKWLLALPHYVVTALLGILAVLATVVAWFSILLTGNYPRGLFGFVVGYERWSMRVNAYAWLLTTDRYPPFRLS